MDSLALAGGGSHACWLDEDLGVGYHACQLGEDLSDIISRTVADWLCAEHLCCPAGLIGQCTGQHNLPTQCTGQHNQPTQQKPASRDQKIR